MHGTLSSLAHKGIQTGTARVVVAAVPFVLSQKASLGRRARAGRPVVQKLGVSAAKSLRNIGLQAVFVLMVLDGEARITIGNDETCVSTNDIAILARGDDASLECRGACYLIKIPRRVIQGIASMAANTPSRLSNINLFARASECPADLRQSIANMREALMKAEFERKGDARILEPEWTEALVGFLHRRNKDQDIFSTAGSVARGIEYIRQRAPISCSLSEIASVAGVTSITLRKNFRACLDMSVATFEQRTRLEWAMALLASARESRSIAELAAAAGYNSGQAFSTAFQRMFGKTPSAVRSHAVRRGSAS